MTKEDEAIDKLATDLVGLLLSLTMTEDNVTGSAVRFLSPQALATACYDYSEAMIEEGQMRWRRRHE